jgi:large subunit ribosomal protein L25
MNEISIEVHRRDSAGKNANRQLRSGGWLPAVVYGGGKEPVPIQMNRRQFLDLWRHGSGENTVFLLQLAGAGAKRHAMIREIQVDPVSREVLHIDFQRVVMTEKVRVMVPIELTGTAYGVKNEAAVQDFVTREVEVECLPAEIPARLPLDVSELHVGQHLEAGAIPLPQGVRLVTEPERTIVSLGHSRLETAPAAEAGEELLETERQEPEVIGRGRAEQES